MLQEFTVLLCNHKLECNYLSLLLYYLIICCTSFVLVILRGAFFICFFKMLYCSIFDHDQSNLNISNVIIRSIVRFCLAIIYACTFLAIFIFLTEIGRYIIELL